MFDNKNPIGKQIYDEHNIIFYVSMWFLKLKKCGLILK